MRCNAWPSYQFPQIFMAGRIQTYSIALIPGDGIGIEVVEAAAQVLRAAAEAAGTYRINFTTLPWGSTFYKETGSFVPEGFQAELQKFHAVLFGAVGLPGMLLAQ